MDGLKDKIVGLRNQVMEAEERAEKLEALKKTLEIGQSEKDHEIQTLSNKLGMTDEELSKTSEALSEAKKQNAEFQFKIEELERVIVRIEKENSDLQEKNASLVLQATKSKEELEETLKMLQDL